MGPESRATKQDRLRFEMAIPKVGAKAPGFTVLTDEGKEVSLGDYKGKNIVLYFYPKDDTPG